MKILAHLLLLLLFACSSEVDDKTIVVATSADNMPFEFIKIGEVVGFDIDLINEIGKRLGKTVKIKNMSFQGLIPALHSMDAQLLIAGMSETEKRGVSVDFSIPYAKSGMSVLTKSGFKIESIDDLQGKVIGAQMGSTWYQYALSVKEKVPNIEIKALANNLLLAEQLMAGGIDSMIVETCQVETYKNMDKNLNSLELPDAVFYFSMVFPRNSSLKADVDKVISELTAEGYIAILEKKWFN